MNLARRLAAEALGALLLAATVIGSGILADSLTPDDAVALLGNTLATAAMLVVLVLMFAGVSGAHFNPAVSLVMLLAREMSVRDAALYTLSQCVGAVCGAMLAHAMFELPLLQTGDIERSGVAMALSECAATFALVLAILMVRRARPEAVAWTVGLVIAAGYWWTASTSFANPAVTLARTLTATFAGVRPADAPLFAAMQIVGALLALGAARLFAPEKGHERIV
ncbi:MAG: aquaporin [Hydrogenophilaceae bacterium]|jgi:glycerol uptake facilitator-like aquaporin|nr:aquaporin [Hydrogenophilaceae bacterium]